MRFWRILYYYVVMETNFAVLLPFCLLNVATHGISPDIL